MASSTPFPAYASVIVDGGIDRPLDYGVPASLTVQPGSRVKVPLRNQTRSGIVLEVKEKPDFARVVAIRDALPISEGLPEDLVKLALWIARYYNAPLTTVLRSMLPGSVRKQMGAKTQLAISLNKTKEELRLLCIDLQRKAPAQARLLETVLPRSGPTLLSELIEESGVSRAVVDGLVKKGLLKAEKIEIDRSPLSDADYFPSSPKRLNDEQAVAVDAISAQEGYATYLLHGITGSGKTEVYLQTIQKALDNGLSSIVLVPEIALTAQTVERFRSRFSGHIALLHYRLSDGERLDEWKRIRSGEAKIIIGARSAIFCPAQNLGLIIVDEEHDGSYKQSDGSPNYSARDVAVVRASLTGSTVVLGSATPSLETYHNAKTGKYKLLTLNNRADTATLPEVKIVDLQAAYERAGGYTLFSDHLLNAIEQRYKAGEQSLLFLNRRGYSSMQWCTSCESAVKCKHCDLSLTFHRNKNALSCHLCDYTLAPPPRTCPNCSAPDLLKFRGTGTEQVERAIHAIFPDIRTLRIDADTTRHKGSHEKLFRQFRSGKADLLIGTQMVAKGLHFPHLTLVGVIGCDSSLNIPDFRASENVFQLITQVAGRAGRGTKKGLVIVQTAMPNNETIKLAAAQDYHAFYDQEIEMRQAFGYPPHTHLIKLTFTGPDEKVTEQVANGFIGQLRLAPPNEILPVVPSGYAKIKDNYRFQAILKGPSVYYLNDQLNAITATLPRNIRLSIDIDPLSTYF